VSVVPSSTVPLTAAVMPGRPTAGPASLTTGAAVSTVNRKRPPRGPAERAGLGDLDDVLAVVERAGGGRPARRRARRSV
jgi:hypothetical protein